MRLTCLLTTLLTLCFASATQADVFKCKTREGKTVISSEPCQEGSRTEAVRPSEKITPEQKHEAEQQATREREHLAEREKARSAEAREEQDSRRKLAEEESARETRCLDNAQREADPALRANLIAACRGVAPSSPVVVQQPVYIPVSPARRHQSGAESCPSGNCPESRRLPAQEKPANMVPPKRNCQTIGGVTRCD